MPGLPPKLQLALEACRVCARTTPKGDIWFGAISVEYVARGVTRGDLASLVELGHLIRTGEGRYELANAQRTPPSPVMRVENPAPTEDTHESQWQEATWSAIGKRLLIKSAVAFGAILAKAALDEVLGGTYEDANGRKHDSKTGRFTK